MIPSLYQTTKGVEIVGKYFTTMYSIKFFSVFMLSVGIKVKGCFCVWDIGNRWFWAEVFLASYGCLFKMLCVAPAKALAQLPADGRPMEDTFFPATPTVVEDKIYLFNQGFITFFSTGRFNNSRFWRCNASTAFVV